MALRLYDFHATIPDVSSPTQSLNPILFHREALRAPQLHIYSKSKHILLSLLIERDFKSYAT